MAAGNLDDNAIYLTPDEEIDLSPYATKEEIANEVNTGCLEIIDTNDNRVSFGKNELNNATDTFEIYCNTDHLLFMSQQDTPALKINTVNGKSLYLNEDIINTESDIYEFYTENNGFTFYDVNDNRLLYLREEGQEMYQELTILNTNGDLKVYESIKDLQTTFGALNGDEIPLSSTNNLSITEAVDGLDSTKLSKTEASSTYATKEYVDSLFASIAEIKSYLGIE